MRVALALVSMVLVGFTATAQADDALIDAGTIEPATLAGGEGWVIWAYHREDGLLRLRAMGPDGVAHDVSRTPFSRMDSVDVGLGRDGTPHTVYAACRSFCHLYELDLATRVERRLNVPPGPRDCRTERPVVDRHVFVLRVGPPVGFRLPKGCKPGISQLRRGRLIRRQAGRSISYYDISGGRLAYQRVTASNLVQVLARRLGRGRATTVAESESFRFDAGVGFTPAWQGWRLWLGEVTFSSGSDFGATVRRLTVGRTVVCRREAREFIHQNGDPPSVVPDAWAFADGAIYYTAAVEGRVELRRRTDPAPRFVPCP